MPVSSQSASILNDGTLAKGKYPNPFFDLSKTYMPKGIKSMLRFCRMYFYRNEFLHSVLHKMTEYPITPLIFEDLSDAELTKNWKTVLYHHLKLKTFLVEIGLDYHVFGNCFVSANQKFKRHLTCGSCGETTLATSMKGLKFQNYGYKGTCPACKKNNVIFKSIDVPVKNIRAINFIRWAPEQIDMEYDPLTGETEYFYAVPAGLKKAINAGKIEKINKIPQIFVDSIKSGKKIKLDPDNIYHFKRPGLSEEDMSWGKPTILPAMSLIWYMQTLRRGNEAIALEHVVPMRAIFPSSAGDVSPALQLNLSSWKSRVQEEISNYRNDPNYIGIFPVPLGYQSLGGDAKSLLTTPELKFLEDSIINSLGVPIEFVKGGATWTGSSVSLRIVENGFLSYRDLLADFLNYFMIPKIAGMLGYAPTKVRFSRLRMSDDAEAKNLALQLNSAGKLADSLLLQDFGYDPAENAKTIHADLATEASINNKRASNQAQAQNIITIETMRGQAQAEAVYLEEKSIINEDLFADEIASEAGPMMQGLDTTAFMKKLTAQMLMLPPPQQMALLGSLQKRMPTVSALLMQRLHLGQEALLQAMPETVSAQESDADRESKKEISQRRSSGRDGQTEKHTASKKGEAK
jgi:hypothetical protein